MTDTQPSPDDLLVSSCLDGTASPDQRARVARDPSLADRLEVFRHVADQVAAEVVAPGPAERDAAIATALAAFDHGTGGDASAAAGGVDELAASRARRSATPRLLVAAVILAVLALPALIALARRSSDTTSSDLASGAASSTDAPAEVGAPPSTTSGAVERESSSQSPSSMAGSADLSQPGASSTGASASPTADDLGSAATPDELRSRVTVALSEPTSTTTTTTNAASPAPPPAQSPGPAPAAGATVQHGDPTTCESAARAAVDGETQLRLATTITYANQPAYVHAFTTPSGTVVVATSADPTADCEVLATAVL